ncbi:MAG TPA: AI-2E family transporter [Nitrospiraceae bacterium]|nr:AI-2E family transporter [Nitrospiraceae bacterium]
MTRRQLFTITFLLLFALLLWELGLILRPFLSPILWAVILAVLTYPVYAKLLATCGHRKNVAAGIMTAGVLIAAVLPAGYGILLVSQQGVEAYAQAAEWLHAGHLKDLGTVLGRLPAVGALSQELMGRVIVAGSGEIETALLEGGKAFSSFLFSQGVDFAKNAFVLVTDFSVMLFTLFFVFRDGPQIYQSVYRAIPLDESHKTKIFERLSNTFKAVVRGTLLIALTQGATVGVAYYALGIPFALFLGTLSGVLAMLPVGGTAIIWAPIALYFLLSGAVANGVILIAIGAGLVGLMDNLLLPILIGVRARLPLLPLFLASFGGLIYFGILGLFLGPIILAGVIETSTIYRKEYQQDEQAPVIAVTTSSRDNLLPTPELIGKPL